MQDFLTMAERLSLNPKRVSNTLGGEYHSACPDCGGTDRFVIHPFKDTGYGWCRQCNHSYGRLQFEVQFFCEGHDAPPTIGKWRANFCCEDDVAPTSRWISDIKELQHSFSLGKPEAEQLKHDRGIAESIGSGYEIGYNPLKRYKEIGGDTVFLPEGWYIFFLFCEEPWRVKIRTKSANKDRRYMQIAGGANNKPLVVGSTDADIILTESEFDAILVAQELPVSAISLGGVAPSPPKWLYHHLKDKKKFYIAPDNDEAGRSMWEKWSNEFDNAILLKTETYKSPAEIFLKGHCLKKWFEDGTKKKMNLINGTKKK